MSELPINNTENNKVIVREHFSSSGEKFTQEIHPFGNAGCFEIIKDQWGREIPTAGSGGMRPWMK